MSSWVGLLAAVDLYASYAGADPALLQNGRDLVLLHLDAVVATSRAKPVADNARASSAAKRRNFWPS
jgi:hypothetical protein